MRFLLTLILTMVPALAQQADAPSKPADQTVQTPAKPADQTTAPATSPAPAKPADQTTTAATSPAPSNPAPTGEQWFTGSLDLGYRFVTGPAGNYPEYRSVVNLGQGLVLEGLDFTIIDPKKRLFDRLDANAFGWGGEPYELAHLNARKPVSYTHLDVYKRQRQGCPRDSKTCPGH